MLISKKGAKAIAAGSLLGLGSLLAACAPTPSGPAPTTTTALPGTTTTTTASVVYACSGAGIIGPSGASPVGPIANQTTTVAITRPTTPTAGSTVAIGVNIGNLNLSPAPGFLSLNAAGVVAGITVTGATGPATVPADNFVGNGASLDLNAASTTATVAAGSNTLTVGQINILSGSTGFVCTPVGTPASTTFSA